MASMRSVFVLVLCLSVANFAAGQVCTYTVNPHKSSDTSGRVKTNWDRTLSVDKFDRACGTLNSVQINFTGNVSGSAGYESLEAAIPLPITLNLRANISMDYMGFPLFFVSPFDSVTNPSIGVYDGVADFSGPSGALYRNLTGAASQSRTFTVPSEVNTFNANAPGEKAMFPTKAVADSRATAGGNIIQQFETFAEASIDVFYVFTGVPACSTEQLIMADPGRCCRQLFFPEIIRFGPVVRETCCMTLVDAGNFDPSEASFPAPLRDNCCDLCPAGSPASSPGCVRDYYKSCCTASMFNGEPPASNPWCVEPSIRSDPHFVAGNGLKYDFMGKAGETYCLFSDKTLHMNMHMIGVRGNTERKATWMNTISIMYYPFYNITISAESPEGTPFTAAHGSVTINGKQMKSQKVSTMVRWHGLTVQRRKTRVFVSIENLIDVEIEVVRAAFWKSADGPGQNYLNFKVVSLNVSDSVHGVLGQTFRSTFSVTDPAAVKGKNGEGVLEGSMADYIASDILAADCKVSQFVGSKSWTDAVELPAVALRAWTGEAGGDSNDDEDDTDIE